MPANIFEPFSTSLPVIFKEMAGIVVKLESTVISEYEQIPVLGVVSVINFHGKIKGRVLIDMEPIVAITIAENLLRERFSNEKDKMVLATVSELNNIICGRAILPINNDLGFKLVMSPPYVFTGKKATICISKIPSASFIYSTLYGQKVKLNVAFEKEE